MIAGPDTSRASVSVVMPCYNAEAFIDSAIQSALAQTHPPLEVLVVDDASSDRSAGVVRRFEAPVRLIERAHAGPAAARNAGVAAARGEWIAFLDADDLWSPDKLSLQLAKAAKGFEAVYCNAAYFGDCHGLPARRGETSELPEGRVFHELLAGNFITTSGVLIRRELLRRMHPFQERFEPTEDWAVWLEAAAAAPFGAVRRPLANYRVHPGGISRDPQAVYRYSQAVLDWIATLPIARDTPASVWRRRRRRSTASPACASSWPGSRAAPPACTPRPWAANPGGRCDGRPWSARCWAAWARQPPDERNMLIGLDARSLARTDVRGIGRYVANLLRAMRAAQPRLRWRLFYDADGPAPDVPADRDVQLSPIRCRGDRWRLWEQLALPVSAGAGAWICCTPRATRRRCSSCAPPW